MSGSRFFLGLIFVALTLTSATVFGQKKVGPSDPSTKPRKVKAEPAKAFKQWIVDVEAIIRPEELDAWNKLQTDNEREHFIDEFWSLRDPSPETAENEYREGYYERMAYVNEHFASGIPGHKTDRGRIYLKYGRPDEIESHPAGGPYNRRSDEGGGSTSTYPFELWFYRHIPGLTGAEIEFVDPTGSGQYRLARNPFEKIASLTDPYRELAGGVGNPLSSRAQDSEFDWMDRMRLLDEAPPVESNHRGGGSRISTPVIDDNPLNSNLQISYFKQSDERVIVAFTVQTENKDLVFRDIGGLQTARVNISGRITSVAGRSIGFFEDAVAAVATPEELVDAKGRKLAYQKALPLPPGRYRVDMLVRDVESGATGQLHMGFEVPKFGTKLSSSSLVLASRLEQIGDVPASRQFVIGDQKVIPNLSATYHQGAPVGVFMQIYNAGIDQTTLRPAVDVEYVLLQAGKEVGKQIEDWQGNSDAGSRLTVARLLDTRRLVPGEYEIAIRIRDRVTGETLAPTAKFTIVAK
jgi:GWxTD domain-containing protein